MSYQHTPPARFTNSLYWKIFYIFLFLLSLLSFAYVYMTVISARRYFEASHQRLNRNVAAHIARFSSPFLHDTLSKAQAEKVFFNAMVMNPSIEVYLLNPEGKVLSYYAPEKKLHLSAVSLVPIHAFITAVGNDYILGDDPRNRDKQKIFSAASIEKGEKLVGYIYVVLAGEAYDTTMKTLLNRHILGLATQIMAITLAATLLIGLYAFRLITRNLKAVISTVEKFHKGDLQSRIKIVSRDEFALLASTFNQMADTLAGNLKVLKTAEALRRELIANVSHDLRTPIAAIQGYAETIMMKSKSLTNADRERYTGIILQSSEKLRKLVEELFELSKLEASESKPHMEVFNVAELMGEVFVQYRILAQPKHLSVSYTSLQAAILVCADIGMIERVMQNLIDNAIKYTPEKGSISIQVDVIGTQVHISVTNTGPGIPSGQIPHLFSRYATSTPDKSPPSGMGLGLVIVKRILDLHSFPISVENTASGETRFTFRMPVYQP
ncbi:HAMP domain-containing histidine kinase [Rhodocytophaga rosea]|uniref:histidine kinase n=1 Tax=Rhodocytophaga rosea TaxID=2704465 RepID=A0A6C0GU93_9BACT|nr:HAMP domain-containing sensor histidine kinase [Rhodocytophaga rosea]QHT71778.1 HAMP domain-containing histidine kinase [Rhodocytophaga rosea]